MSGMEAAQLDAMRKAAATMITAASAQALRGVLRVLLDGSEPAPIRQPHSPSPPNRKVPPGTATHHGNWLALRRRMRAEMARRGTDEAQLAAEIGMARTTVHNALGKRSPSSAALTRRLTKWLAGAEVALQRRFAALVEPTLVLPAPVTEQEPASTLEPTPPADRAPALAASLSNENGPAEMRPTICSWEEHVGGETVRCTSQAVRGKAWCLSHLQRFRYGQRIGRLPTPNPGGPQRPLH